MVKCADCGFLAVRSLVDYSLGEAASDFREKGAVAIGRDDKGRNQHPLHELRPLCFQGAYDLRKEILERKGTGEVNDVLDIIRRDRPCSGDFTDWQMGFTPKEHREMIDRQWEKKDNRKWTLTLVIVAGGFTILGTILGVIISRV